MGSDAGPQPRGGVLVPEEVRASVQLAWTERVGRAARLASASRVGGGCISPAARVETESGDVAFLKWGAEPATPQLFVEEARSLTRLAAAGTIRVPEVLAVAEDGAWLLLEWLQPGRASAAAWRSLGAALARLHHVRSERFGWDADNYIGSLPQRNGWSSSWGVFWRERRLLPQIRRAHDAGLLEESDRERFERLLAGLEDRLDATAAGEGASLLHGDLWSGNVHMLDARHAAVIDPSSYYGHREVDVAMSELFGGFDPAFYEAYERTWPLAPGYREERRAVYQLYYLLVHVNLFGAGYLASTRAALDRALGGPRGG